MSTTDVAAADATDGGGAPAAAVTAEHPAVPIGPEALTFDPHPTDETALGPAAGRSLAWWGMVLAIVTEAMIFALLLFSWFYLWARADRWPPPGTDPPELNWFTWFRTALLLGSSIPMQLAERRIAGGRRRGLLAWTAAGWLMAVVFLGGHIDETVRSWRHLRPSSNAYGSLVYLITNLHALHLIVGLAFMGTVFARALRGRYDPGHHGDVTVSVLYWHFVDVVWIAVFSSLYLATRLGPG